MDILAKILTLVLFLGFLSSCASAPSTPTLNPDTVYKRDMVIEIDGRIGEGVIVVPQKLKHSLHLTAQGDLDLFTLTTCHREESAENAGNVTTRTGFLFKRTITKKREVTLDYSPTEIERSGGCPIFLGGYEQEKGRHSWGLIDFETPEAQLPALVSCNGKEIKSNGVSICQSREGLIQSIKFEQSVKVFPPAGCELDKSEGDYFRFKLRKGQCVYAFGSSDKKIHRLTTIGYELIPIRK